MKIIVAGIGKVGYAVTERLAKEQHDVVVIDTNAERLNDAVNDLDVFGIVGNGAAHTVLQEAGVEDCELLLALTDSDEVNMLCCLIGKKLGAGATIARVRNHEYSEEMPLIQDSMGLTMIVNPEEEAAKEILRIIQFPGALKVYPFADGKLKLISFKVGEKCPLVNRTVMDSFSNISQNALICTVKRDGQVFIPTGDFVIREKDLVVVLVETKNANTFFRTIGNVSSGIENIMIIGGGKITRYLGEYLEKLHKRVTIIERDEKIAENLCYQLPKTSIICGDGTNESLLIEEGIKEKQAICCLTGIDEENLLLSLFAAQLNPKIKTIAKVNRTNFKTALGSLDIGSVIYPKYTAVSKILSYVREKANRKKSSTVAAMRSILDNQVEVLELKIKGSGFLVGKQLSEVSLKKNVLIGSIIRDGEIIIPKGQDVIREGDSVLLITTIEGITDIDDIRGASHE